MPAEPESVAEPSHAASTHRVSERRVAVFVTCLVDSLFPRVGEATVRVLRRLGVEVTFPEKQTCCGQPAFNAGYRDVARHAALHFLDVFEESEAIVCPSGSCAAMVKEHYPTLFERRRGDEGLAERCRRLGEKTYELSRYLTDVLGISEFPGRCRRSVTWHDCCHSLRSLHIKEGPRRLLRSIEGIDFRELSGAEVCCGFGGLFCVKFEGISVAMLEDKISCLEKSAADCLVATDASCLMHIEGGLRRQGSTMRTQHLAEFLWEAMEEAGER